MKGSSVIAALVCAIALLLAASPLPAAEVPAGNGNGKAVGEAVAGIEAEYAAENSEAAPGFPSEAPLVLDEVEAIRLTARYSPQIRRAYERKTAEEARYDFFIFSREAFSYGATTDFEYERFHNDRSSSLEKTVAPRVFVRKEFYNTAAAFTSVGYELWDFQSGHEGNAFAEAGVSIPLFASREALARSNEKIYQQTKVNDARLEYYQQIRWQVSDALYNLAHAQQNQENLEYLALYMADLEEILRIASAVTARDTAADAAKIQATIASAKAEYDSAKNEFEISAERVKYAVGIPFSLEVTISSRDFNPFAGEARDELERVAVETDEEIKTLLNSIKGSQAELDLARKGKWDTSLTASARREFEGTGQIEGDADYLVTAGVSVTRIDDRISRSLEQIALANIRESRDAIVNRRRGIHADIVDAFTSLNGQMSEVAARQANLSRYRDDYVNGIELYKAGSITIDQLIQKRQTVRDEQNAIVDSRQYARDSLTTLLAATGRYEQFLDKENGGSGRASQLPDARPSLPARGLIEGPK